MLLLQLVLADKYERYELTYEGCHVFNPGSFLGNSFEWSTYYPSSQRSERWCVGVLRLSRCESFADCCVLLF